MWSGTSMISIITILVNVGLTIYNSIMTRRTNIFIENERQRHAHDLQSESYFKQKGAEEQKEILNTWVKFMTNMEEMVKQYSSQTHNGRKKMNQLIHDTFMYGSDKTCILLALYSRHNYDNEEALNKEDELTAQKGVVYIAFIIASLKYDFTDEKIDPLLILQIQITDYSRYAGEYKSFAEEIEKEIQNKRD